MPKSRKTTPAKAVGQPARKTARKSAKPTKSQRPVAKAAASRALKMRAPTTSARRSLAGIFAKLEWGERDPEVTEAVIADLQRWFSAEWCGRKPDPRAFRAKKAAIISLLQRPDGAALGDLTAATGWQVHSVRAALTGLRKEG
jgi:hypothetical protein